MNLVDKDNIKQKIQRYLIPNTDENGMVNVEDAERYFLNLLDKVPVIETPKWNISKNNPPEEDQRVLGFDDDCQIGDSICTYTFKNGLFFDDEGFSYTCSEITHWFPIPTVPELNKN